MNKPRTQRNQGEAGGYRVVDHLVARAVSSLSHVVGVKNVTRPFWNRWRASGIGEETIMRFLNSIDSINDWPHRAMELVTEAEHLLTTPSIRSDKERIFQLRRISYLAHLAQWGCLGMDDVRLEAYRKSRDYYIEAESLAWGDRYHRVGIPWDGGTCYGNLHLPDDTTRPVPLVIILHGMDDSKEEHLATELASRDAGLAILGIDGPGQAESLLLQQMTWPSNFHRLVSAAIDELATRHPIDNSRVGVIGISWGGMWAIKAAAVDSRVTSVYDLGGPIDADRWQKLPYFLKSKYAQVLGVRSEQDIPQWREIFSITDEDLLSRVRVPVRIVHGRKDPLVPVRDKEWLRQTLVHKHPQQEVSLRTFDDGDHCCTAYGAEIRADGAEFFRRTLSREPAST